MDFHAAMETFAEAWVAANTQTAVNTDTQSLRPTPLDELPTMLTKEQLTDARDREVPTMKSSPKKETPSIPVVSHGAVRQLPIHCVVEQVPSIQSFDRSEGVTVELDSYAIVASTTLFNEVVRTVLIKLGYTASEAIGAKGAIQIQHWKPLLFDSVTERPTATVGEILGEMTSVATLRIRLQSPKKRNPTDDVKEKLLHLLLSQSTNILQSSGCPLEKSMLALITNGRLQDVPEETRQAFNRWYMQQLEKSKNSHHGGGVVASQDLTSSNGDVPSSESILARSLALPAGGATHSLTPSAISPLIKHEALFSGGSMSPRTRIRTSFDPDYEIPKLQRWFQINQHPSREQMLQFLHELNMESRRGRKPLDLTNIIYWFKNARAAQRRASKHMEVSTEDSRSENGDYPDEHMSPVSEDVNIPDLPNKNAVYVVSNPMYHGRFLANGATFPGMEEAQDLSKKSMPVKEAPSSEHNKGELKKETDENSNMEVDKMDMDDDEDDDNDLDSSGERPLHIALDSEACETSTPNKMAEPLMGEAPMTVKQERYERDIEYGGSNSASNASTPQPASMTAIPQPQPLNLAYMPSNGTHSLPSTPYFSQYHAHDFSPSEANRSSSSLEERRKRTRVFIDPLTEIPKLEVWFIQDTHPSAFMIEKFTEELNRSEYRHRFPKLEPKNVQLWFKNHRAKVKRMRLDPEACSPGQVYSQGPPCDSLTSSGGQLGQGSMSLQGHSLHKQGPPCDSLSNSPNCPSSGGS